MTESEALTIGQETEAVRYSASSGIQRGGARGRAEPSLTAAPAASAEAVTDSAGMQARAQGFADSLAAKWQAKSGTIPPLAHAHTLTLAEGRDRIHAAVAYQSVPVVKAARVAYGYLHLLLGLVCDAVKEGTRSPWGLLIGVVAVAAFWLYL